MFAYASIPTCHVIKLREGYALLKCFSLLLLLTPILSKLIDAYGPDMLASQAESAQT